jgi:hypothetical protein
LSGPAGIGSQADRSREIVTWRLLNQLGRASEHLRDIAGVLKVQADRIDRHYIAQWADRLGVSEEWGLFPEQ